MRTYNPRFKVKVVSGSELLNFIRADLSDEGKALS